jgi:coenzyme F420-0:L-glutamate ligase / coenzyme F420-1:gamma-L-glutamate ligase
MPQSIPLQIFPITGLPNIQAGQDLAALIPQQCEALGLTLQGGDVVVVAQKIVSKAEGRRVRLADVPPSARAQALADVCHKDPRLIELVLRESARIVRCAHNVLIVQHRLGFTVANAGIDQSNIESGDDHALLLPEDPDRSARQLHETWSARGNGAVGVIVNDSFGRPWRRGTCGVAIGCAGIEALVDLRGRTDRFGRRLRTSETAHADEIAAAASLVMGQAAEGIPAVLVRGLEISSTGGTASDLIRPAGENLFT